MAKNKIFSAVVVLALAVAVVTAEPTMVWLSPKESSPDATEDFSAERFVWSNISTGAGSRTARAVFHIDSKGSIWIFGGTPQSNGNYFNALWNYDPIKDQYRWVAGNATVGSQYVNFGEMGVPADDVFPGFNDFSAHAIDNNDNIWIYGGESAEYNYNTLWMFNTTSLQFTWIGGNETNLNPAHGNLGQSSPDFWPGYNEGACMVFDSQNNLWLIGGYNSDGSTSGVWMYNVSRQWSLQSGNLTNFDGVPNFETNYWSGRWMPACTIDEDDRVWIFGGYANTNPATWNDMWSFDTKTVAWRVELGFNQTFGAGSVVSFDTYDAENYPGARDRAGMVDRRDGTLMLVGGYARTEGLPYHDIWVFNKTSKLWKVVFGEGNNITIVNSTYSDYRAVGSKLGSRFDHAIEQGLTSNGHVILFGGTDDERNYNDIWVIPQDLCASTVNDCDPNASCATKTMWTYECTCNEGYTGDGKTCTVTLSAPQPSTNQPSAQPTATPTKATSGASSFLASFSVGACVLALVW